MLRTPLLGDDAFNSFLTGYTGFERINLAEFFVVYNQWIIASIGRFFPGEIGLQVLEFGLTQSAVTVKILQCTLIIANVVTFWYFIRALRASRPTATIAAVIALMTMQLRIFHDPIIGPSLTLPLVLEFFLLSALCEMRFLATGRAAWLAASAALFALNASLYEISYLYLVVIVLIALVSGYKRRGIVAVIVHCAIFAAFVAIDLILRSGHQIADNSEYHIHFDPSATALTLYYQVIAAFPLVYLHVNHAHIFESWPSLLLKGSGLGFVIAAVTFAIVYAAVKERLAAEPAPSADAPPLLLVIVGLLLAVIPAIPLSLSPYWQKTLYFGVGFLAVYLSGFGIALLLSVCVSWFAVSFKRSGLKNGAAAALVASVACIVLTLTYRANGVVAHEFDGGWRYPRDSLAHALEFGLLDGVPDDATLVFDRSYPFFYGPPAPFFWDEKYVVYFYTHRRFKVVPAEDATLAGPFCKQSQRAVCKLPADTWVLRNSATSGVWNVTLAHTIALSGSADRTDPAMLTDRVRIFHRGPGALNAASYPSTALGANLDLIKQTGDATLSELRTTCAPVDTGALLAAAPFRLNYGEGSYGEEPLAGGGSFHWMRDRAQLSIVNESALVQEGTLRVIFATFGSQRPTVSVNVANRRLVLPIDARIAREVPFEVAPRSSIVIRFTSSASRVVAPGDPRDMHYQIRDVSVRSTGQHCAWHGRPAGAHGEGTTNAVRVRR